MASIFATAKSMISKITDDLNKDKWDKNCINSALFTDPEPGKLVPPNRNGVKADDGGLAVAVAADGTAVAEAVPSAPIVAPAPQIDYGKSEPQVKQTVAEPAEPAEPKKEPVRFVNPRFSRAMPYVTSKVKKPEDGLRSLSDLPKVDPSQSISHISEGATLPGEEETAPAVEQTAAAPAAEAATVSEAAPAVETAPAAATVSVPEYTPTPAEATASAPAAAAPVEAAPAVPEYIPAAAETVSVPEYKPAPAEEAVAEAAPAEAAVPVEAAPAAAEEEEKCYYVLITHRKIYPEKGSRIMMRNCDSQYAWTDSVDESKKPTFPTCPVCGKTIEYIETEMD